MEGADYILAHKTDRGLFVLLTKTPKGRRQWEYVDDLQWASRFPSIHSADAAQQKHRCPPSCAVPREYVAAHSDWLRHIEIKPLKTKQLPLF